MVGLRRITALVVALLFAVSASLGAASVPAAPGDLATSKAAGMDRPDCHGSGPGGSDSPLDQPIEPSARDPASTTADDGDIGCCSSEGGIPVCPGACPPTMACFIKCMPPAVAAEAVHGTIPDAAGRDRMTDIDALDRLADPPLPRPPTT